MEKIHIDIDFAKMQLDELTDEDQLLVNRAIEATTSSYAPYSKFCVGAAVLLDNETIVIGANQENASFPAGICAERTALFAAAAAHPQEPVKAIAIAARNVDGLTSSPVPPCGLCRQVMLETEQRSGHAMRIMLYGQTGVYVFDGIKDLLPLQFVDANMR